MPPHPGEHEEAGAKAGGLRAPASAERARRCRAAWDAISLPAALWLLGTALLTFHLGLWTDDYDLAGIDPVTGEIERLTWIADSPYWRPLHLIFTMALETVSFHRPWLGHAAINLLHALCVWLVFCLSRSLGLGVRAGAACAVLFLTYPLHAQAIHWIAAFGTVAATATALGACVFAVRIVRDGLTPARLAALWALSWATPCWNEQATGAFLALPALALVCLGRRGSIMRTGVVCAIAWLGAVLYLGLYVTHAPADWRGSRAQAVGVSEVFEGAIRLGEGVLALHRWETELAHAWAMSVRTGAAFALPGMIAIALVLVAGAAWVRRFAAWRSDARLTPRSCVAITLFAIGAGLACFAPILLASGWTLELRYLHAPAAWLVIALVAPVAAACAGLERVTLRAERTRRGARTALGVAIVLAGLAGAVLQLGYAGAFRERWVRDQHEAAALVRAIPAPGEHAFFLPLRVATEGVGDAVIEGESVRGVSRFETSFMSVWAVNWASPNVVQQVYRRRDLSAGWVWTPGGQSPVLEANADRVRIPTAFRAELEPAQAGGYWLSWDRAVPFTVEGDGSVRAWARVAITGADGSRVVVACPAIGEGAAAETRPFAIASDAWWQDATLRAYAWPDGSPGVLSRRMLDAVPLDSLWMHSAYDAIPDRHEADLAIPTGTRRLALRARLADPGRSTDGVTIDADAAHPDGSLVALTATLRIEPTDAHAGGWRVVILELPPGVSMVRLRVGPGDRGDVAYDGVWVHAAALGDASR